MAEKKEVIQEPKVDKKKMEIQQSVINIIDQWVREEMQNRLTRNNAWALRTQLNNFFNQLEIEQ